MYIKDMDKLRTPDQKRRMAQCKAASEPPRLAPGVHVKNIRALPADLDCAMEDFYAKMYRDYPSFEILNVNTNLTYSAMVAYITFRV